MTPAPITGMGEWQRIVGDVRVTLARFCDREAVRVDADVDGKRAFYGRTLEPGETWEDVLRDALAGELR